MALYDITYINGITKVETDKGFVYHFPLEIIETDTSRGSMKRTQRGQTTAENVQFSHVANKLGAGDIEGYVDRLAEKYSYSYVLKQDTGTLKTGQVSTDFEMSVKYSLGNIEVLLKEVVFLLKGISE